MNLQHTHSFVIPIWDVLVTLAAGGLTVILTVFGVRVLDWIEGKLLARSLQKEANAIFDRLGNVPRGHGHHGGSYNGIGVPPDFLAEKGK